VTNTRIAVAATTLSALPLAVAITTLITLRAAALTTSRAHADEVPASLAGPQSGHVLRRTVSRLAAHQPTDDR
jgi:hypothetical protein